MGVPYVAKSVDNCEFERERERERERQADFIYYLGYGVHSAHTKMHNLV